MEYNEEKREIILEEDSFDKKPRKYPEDHREKPKRKWPKGLIIWGIVLVLFLCFIGFIANGFNSLTAGGYDSTYVPQLYGEGGEEQGPFVGVLYVEGIIASQNTDDFGIPYGYQHDWTLEQIDKMIDDDNNKGMLIYVDSPGGGVFESDELYFKIKEYQELTERPVYIAMGTFAASGGYYISAPADKIYANRNTWTGSIGVTIGTLFDISELLSKNGIKTTTISQGRNKSMGGYTEPLTQEQEAIFRGLVDEAYLQFVTLVSEERKIPLEKTKEIADGRIYTARQAKELGLIDGILTLQETKDKMIEDEKLFGCSFLEIYYIDHSLMSKLFGKISFKGLAQSDVGVLMNLVEENSRFPIAYLYQ